MLGIDVIIAGHNPQNISKKIINNVVITKPHCYGIVVPVVNLTVDIDATKNRLKSKKLATLPVKSYPADPTIEKSIHLIISN